MATIRERRTGKGEKRYFVEIRRRGSRPIRKTFQRKTAAKAWVRRVEAELETRRVLPYLESERHTVQEMVDRYLEEERTASLVAHERKNRDGYLKWWAGRLGHLTLADLTPAAISEARQSLLARGAAPATANRYLAALSACLGVAQREWQWLEDNPVRNVRRLRESRGRVRFLSEEERDRLLTACQESRSARLYPLTLFAMTTGARQGELMNLCWEDVDLAAGRAVLHKTKNQDRRTLSFPGRAGEVLREMAQAPHISGYLFASRKTGAIQFPRKAWLDALRAAEIDDFRFHDLRNTAASYLAMSGATLSEIAAFLGHRTLAMVKRYSHLAESHSEAVAARMAEKFLP